MLHRKNKTVQEHLYDHMDELLQLDVAIPDMAEVLTEVCEYIQYKVALYKLLCIYILNSSLYVF